MTGGVNLDQEHWIGASLNTRTLGNYLLLQPIGRGRTAEVYLAEHIERKTHVAVKLLLLHLTDEEQQAFLNDMQIIAALKHPHLVRILDYGVAGNIPYTVMSYAPYGTLSHILPPGQLQPPEKILPYIEQLADALQCAHKQHLLHLDLQPGNLLLGSNYEVWLSDIAMTLLVQGARSSSSLDIVGNILYLAPEQLKGKHSPASDQYALAVIAYEWLCGHSLFEGTFIEIGKQHLHTPVPSLRASVPSLPLEIEQVVQRALAKDPAQRFESIKAFARAFEGACRPQSFPPFSLSNVLNLLPAERETLPPAPISANTPATLDTLDTSNIPIPTNGLSITTDTPTLHTVSAVEPSLHVQASEEFAGQPVGMALEPREPSSQPPVDGDSSLLSTSPWPAQAMQDTLLPVLAQSPSFSSRTTQPPSSAWPMANAASAQSYPPSLLPAPASTFAPLPITPALDQPDQPLHSIWTPMPGVAAPEIREQHTFTQRTIARPGAKMNSTSAPSSAYVNKRLPQRPDMYVQRFSRRTVIAGLLGLAGLAAAGGGAAWYLMQPHTTAMGTTLYTYTGHENQVLAVAWQSVAHATSSTTATPRIASGSLDHTVQVWDALTGNHVFTYKGHNGAVEVVAWSPDGTRIASGSLDHTVQVWDASTGHRLLTYSGHSDGVLSLSWSPDGKYIASAGKDATVQVWDTKKGHRLFIYHGHKDWIGCVVWSPDGKSIASASADKTVQVIDAYKGQRIVSYAGHTDKVWTVAWASDSQRLASGGDDHTVQVWQATTGPTSHPIYTYRGHSSPVETVAWSPDGDRIASGSEDRTVQVWNPAVTENAFTYSNHLGTVWDIAWSPDGTHIASASLDHTVQVWQAV